MPRISEKNSRSELSRTASLRLLLVLCLFSSLLLSCATTPPSQPTAGWLAVLPPLSPDSLYASVDVASSWSLLEVLAGASGNETEQLERIIGNLDRVHARIRPSPGESPGPEFYMIALGKLWSGSVARQLNRDPSWQRIMLEPLPGRGFTSSRWSYRTYWRKAEFQIAVPEPGVLFVTGGVQNDGDPAGGEPERADAAGTTPAGADLAGAEALLRRLHAPQAQPLPPEARGVSESADIFFYFPDPAVLALSAAASSRAVSTRAAPSAQEPGALLQNLPIRQGWISARQLTSPAGKEGYQLEVVFLLAGVENPRSVEMLLRLMLTLWLRKSQVEDPVQTLKAATFRADSESARIESLFLETGEIAYFLGTLLPENFGGGLP
jgi:hypothetical protein